MSLDTRRPITISSSRSSVLSLSECGATFTIEGGVAFLAPFLHGTEIGAYLSVCFSWLCQRPLFFVTKYDSLMLVLCPLTLSLSLPTPVFPLSLLLWYSSYRSHFCWIAVVVYFLSCVQLFCGPKDCSLSGSSVYGIFPDKNTGVDCQFLLQGIFLTQG